MENEGKNSLKKISLNADKPANMDVDLTEGKIQRTIAKLELLNLMKQEENSQRISNIPCRNLTFIDDADTQDEAVLTESRASQTSETTPLMTEKKWSDKDFIDHHVKTNISKKDQCIPAAVSEAIQQYTFIANNQSLANKSNKPKNTFIRFCEETNLNGWYFMSKDNLFSRVFWAIIIFLSIVLACFTTYIISYEFLEANIIITIGSITASLDKVVFPGIIVCNQNKVCGC